MGSSQLCLGDLPFELHLLIFSFLDFPSTMALRQSAHHYYETLEPHKFDRHITDDYLACHLCYRVLLRSDFGNSQTKQKRRRGARDAYKRFCFDCGLKHRYFGLKNKISFGEDMWGFCGSCYSLGIREGDLCDDCAYQPPKSAVDSSDESDLMATTSIPYRLYPEVEPLGPGSFITLHDYLTLVLLCPPQT